MKHYSMMAVIALQLRMSPFKNTPATNEPTENTIIAKLSAIHEAAVSELNDYDHQTPDITSSRSVGSGFRTNLCSTRTWEQRLRANHYRIQAIRKGRRRQCPQICSQFCTETTYNMPRTPRSHPYHHPTHFPSAGSHTAHHVRPDQDYVRHRAGRTQHSLQMRVSPLPSSKNQS